jgi:hypothetical protein
MPPGGSYRLSTNLSYSFIYSAKIRVVCATAGYFGLLSQAFLVVVLPNLHLMTARKPLTWVHVSNMGDIEMIESISQQ